MQPAAWSVRWAIETEGRWTPSITLQVPGTEVPGDLPDVRQTSCMDLR